LLSLCPEAMEKGGGKGERALCSASCACRDGGQEQEKEASKAQTVEMTERATMRRRKGDPINLHKSDCTW
jgi:hypothetical protein